MNIKSFSHIVLVLTFFFSNALAVHSAEANFWKERRVQSKRQFSSATGAGVQALATDAPGNSSALLLAQLPGAQPVGLNGNASIPSFSADLPVPPVGEILKSDLTAAQSALTRDGSADWLDPLVNPYGTVREIHLSKKADTPLIIHIQDVHGYVDAQKNIAGMIDGLAKYRGVHLIGMEAAEGAFALEDLRRFPDRDIKERVTNWAIKKDLIGGAEKSGIMAEKPLTLWGVENTALYQSNVQAVKDSLARRGEALAFHSEWVKNVAQLKTAVYSEELKKYDDNLLAYQDKRRGLGEYLKHLTSQSGGGQAEMAKQFPNTAMLLKALDQEAGLDFKQVERERVDLVERLAARLDERTLNGLVKESMAYRAGRVTYGRYYAYVKDLCRQAKIDLTKFPGLTDYIAYVGLSEKINRERLLNELEKLEDVVASRLAHTALERGVLSLAQDGVLLGKLLNNAMTPADWGRYLHRRGEILNLETRGKTLAQRAGIPFDLGIPQDFAEFVHPFEEFCRLALARNDAFADNLFAKMGQDNVKTAVLVTGDFHTEGLLAEIDRRGGSYVVLTPRVEIVQSDKNYLDAFAHDPVPLEKLFDGEKISILAERGTTVTPVQAEGVTVSQKIAIAMVTEKIQAWFGELLAERRPLKDIRQILATRLLALLTGLGSVFQEMKFSIKKISFENFMLQAQVEGRNYYETIGSTPGAGVSVSTPPLASMAGLENAYVQFERTTFGRWLKRNNDFLFQSIAEIFFAPWGMEKPFTADLKAFGTTGHDYIALPVHPMGWVAMAFDKSVDWKSVARSSFGWMAIGLMATVGFAPTIATFYLTFVGPLDFVRMSVGLLLLVIVGAGNYKFRTHFYAIAHGPVNLIIITINLVLAFLNIIFPKLSFRLSRLTVKDSSSIRSQIKSACAEIKSIIWAGTFQSSLEERWNAVNQYWGLKMLERDYPDYRSLRILGLAEPIAIQVRQMVTNKQMSELVADFDAKHIRSPLLALSGLVRAMNANDGYAECDLNAAMEGLAILRGDQNVLGFKMNSDLSRYIQMRTNNSLVGNEFSNSENISILLASEHDDARRYVELRRDFEYARNLVELQDNSEALSDIQFSEAAGAYERILQSMGVNTLNPPDLHEEQIAKWLDQFGLSDSLLEAMQKLLGSPKLVGILIANRRPEPYYDDTEISKGQTRKFIYGGPTRIILERGNGSSVEKITCWVYREADIPPELKGEFYVKKGWDYYLFVERESKVTYVPFDTEEKDICFPEINDLFPNPLSSSGPKGVTLKRSRETKEFAVVSYIDTVKIYFPRKMKDRGHSARPGAVALWERMGLKNLTLAGVLETAIDLLAASLSMPGQLTITSSASLPQLGMAALDVTGTLFIILLAGKFLVHFLGGVSQPGDQPAKTLRNTTPLEMFFVALGATRTASKSLVMLPFIVVAFLAPVSAWIAVPLGIVGALWGTYLHAWSNYLLEVPSLNHVEPASGVAIESYPVDAEGNLLTPDPRANFIGFLKRIAFGGPATPAYGSVAQAIYSVHVKERMGALAANSGSLAAATIEKNPEAWIANQALANRGEKNDSEMEDAMKFYNMAVFFSNRLLALAKQQPEGPLLIEVPSAQELQQNPTTRMALAAVLMAHGASESLKNRPLSLVARGEGSMADGQAWTSKEQVQSAAVEALQKYDPTMALQFFQHVKDGNVKIVRAAGSLITADGQGFRYNLAEILSQTYGRQKYSSAVVFGREEHFNTKGIDAVVQNYFDLAARLVESMKGIVLFLTAA